jgi:hypothetical protein
MTTFGITPHPDGPLARKLAAEQQASEPLVLARRLTTLEAVVADLQRTKADLERRILKLESASSPPPAAVDLAASTKLPAAAPPPIPSAPQRRRAKVDVADIIRVVAIHYQIRYFDMLSERRDKAIVRPRQIAMYLAKDLTSRSLPDIGRRFGDKDHTTVLHAATRIEEMMAGDPAFAAEVEALRQRCISAPERRP